MKNMSRQKFHFDNWEYKIIDNQNEYGFALWIYRNDTQVYFQSGFGAESIAEAYAKKYVIETQFNIELNDYEGN